MRKLSFCTTLMDWMDYFKDVFLQNMQDYKGCENHVEFVVLDYNSKDGLPEFIKKHGAPYIESGLLNYYRTIEEYKYLHMAHSKNIAHKLATGDIVCTLDGDNFAVKGCAERILDLCKPYDSNVILRRGKGCIRGKVAVFKNDFIEKLGGYDERYEGHDGVDRDFFERASKILKFKEIHFGKKFFNRLGNDLNTKYNKYKKLDKPKDIKKEALNSRKQGIGNPNAGKIWGSANLMKNFETKINV